jgi:hypothetical protein
MYETKINELNTAERPGKRFKSFLDSLLLKRISQHLKPLENLEQEIQLLEIGTGSGHLAKQLLDADSRIRYVGVEPTTTLRKATTELLSPFGNRVHVIDSSLPELLNVSDVSFDACMMFHLLEHATDQIQAHLWLTSIFKKMKVGGRVIIVCPNLFDYKSYFYDGDWSHGYPTTTRRIELLGVDAGFVSREATDLRANSNNLLVKGLLALISKLIPTGLINQVGHKIFGVPYIGMGVQAALFWRNCWVVLEKPAE